MHIAEIHHGHNRVVMHHEGVEHVRKLSEWQHPRLPGPEGEEGPLDTLTLILNFHPDDPTGASFTISALGDAGAQQMFVRILGLGGPAMDELKARVEAEGAIWHLDDDGDHAVMKAAMAIEATTILLEAPPGEATT